MLPKSFKPIFFDTLSNMTGRYVKPEPYRKASGLVARVYQQIVDEFFINGPITTHAVIPELLAGVWMAEREILLTDDRLTREDKEALGVTFSQVNGCSYCEDLINSVVYGAQQQQLAELMRFRKQDEIEDEKTRALHSWALHSYDPDAGILYQPPFDADEAAEVIGTAFMLNYFNRYVRVFFAGTPLKAPFKSRSIKSLLYRLTGIELRESVTRRLQPGISIDFLEPAPLPADLLWTAGSATISAAMSRWAAVMDEVAEKQIPGEIRDLLTNETINWGGEPMGLGRSWLEPRVQGLGEAQAAGAKLALLTALAPSQMSDGIIDDCKRYFDDRTIIVIVSWAAYTASRRVAGWLAEKSGHFDQEQFLKAG